MSLRLLMVSAVGLAVAGCAGASPPPDLSTTAAKWREDLRFMADALPKRHISAFHHISRQDFDARVADLDRRLDTLDADQRFVGFEQIARSIGDGHTGFWPLPPSKPLPFRVARFGTEYRITEAAPGQERLLGAVLDAIDGMPIAEVRQRLLSVTPADEGDGLRDGVAASRLSQGLFLHGLGVTASDATARLGLRDESGRAFEVPVAALPETEPTRWLSASAAAPLMRQHADDPLWCAPASPDTLYCDFRSYRGLAGPAAALRDRLASNPPDKLVIDLRQNDGGDFNVGLRDLVDPIAATPQVNRKGRLYVLIGPMTFSAAMSNAAHFRQRTQAILVGEPIGERPNSYQENREVVLPNTHLTLSYSTRLYQFAPGDPSNEIRPDVRIETSWSDYKAGRDPVLDWIVRQPVPAIAAR